MKGRVLVVEDDTAIAMALRDRLQNEGYAVECAGEGNTGLESGESGDWDLLILDLMLPGIDGLEICRKLRAKGADMPILMLTARGDTVDKVVGLKMGADDYLTKPFEMAELLARVEALLRRGVRLACLNDRYSIGDFRLDIRKGDFFLDREVIPLTTYEFKLLKFFCEHRGKIIDRDDLLNEIWGYESAVYSRTVDVHIASLRRKLGDSRKNEHIVTIRGRGYKLVE